MNKSFIYNSSSVNRVLTNLNKEIELKVIFLDNKIDKQKLGYIYVSSADFNKEETGEHSQNSTTYSWSSAELSLTARHENEWKYGKASMDNRYGQPEKIHLKWTVLYCYEKLNEFKITLKVDMLSKQVEISVVDSEMDELILDYLFQKLAIKSQ